MKKTAQRNGFSLVELIITVVIMIVLVSIGTAAINNFTQSKKLETVSDELMTQIKLARNMAITTQLPIGITGDFSFVDVGVSGDFTVTGRSIRRNPSTGALTTVGTYFSKKIENTNGLTITSSLPSFGFSLANGRLVSATDGTFINGPATFTLRVTGVATTRVFSINNLGLFNE